MAAALAVGHSSLREEADDYAGVLVRVGPDLRVIVCRQGLQWIVQRRRVPKKARVEGRWTAVGFCRTQQGLIRVSHRHVIASEGPALRVWAMEQPLHFPVELHVDGRVPMGKRD